MTGGILSWNVLCGLEQVIHLSIPQFFDLLNEDNNNI